MDRDKKIKILKVLATPGGNLPKPRSGGTFIEIAENIFESEAVDRISLTDLQNLAGQTSPTKIDIVFDTPEEAGQYYTTDTGTPPFVREIALDNKIYYTARIYTLSPLSLAMALELITNPK